MVGWWTWPRAGPELGQGWTGHHNHIILYFIRPADQWGGNNSSNAQTNWLISPAIRPLERKLILPDERGGCKIEKKAKLPTKNIIKNKLEGRVISHSHNL